jgi:hypothetical protein
MEPTTSSVVAGLVVLIPTRDPYTDNTPSRALFTIVSAANACWLTNAYAPGNNRILGISVESTCPGPILWTVVSTNRSEAVSDRKRLPNTGRGSLGSFSPCPN